MYKKYMTDSLYYIGQGKSLAKRYAEIIGLEKKEADNRTGDEIAADVINRMGLKL